MEKNDIYITGMIFFSGLVIYSFINSLTGMGIGAMVILFFLLLAYRE